MEIKHNQIEEVLVDMETDHQETEMYQQQLVQQTTNE